MVERVDLDGDLEVGFPEASINNTVVGGEREHRTPCVAGCKPYFWRSAQNARSQLFMGPLWSCCAANA